MKMRSSTPVLLPTEARFKGSNDRIVGRDGNINAGNKQELMHRLLEIAEMVGKGELTKTISEDRRDTVRARREMVRSAYYDESGRQWAELGSAVAAELAEVGEREGFARNLLHRVDVAQGSFPVIDVKQTNVTAVIASSPASIYAQFLKNKKLMPPEFDIVANLLVDERELAQGPSDILEQKFIEGQQQIQVKEDQVWKLAVDATIGAINGNQQQIFGGPFTPGGLGVLFDSVGRWNLQPTSIVMASDAWTDVLTGSNFTGWFDPVSQYEIVTSGYIGRLMGLNVRTDAYREPILRVLNAGEIYVTAAPEYHGALTDRGPVQSKDVPVQRAARGWFLWELISLVVHNPRSVVKGLRSA